MGAKIVALSVTATLAASALLAAAPVANAVIPSCGNASLAITATYEQGTAGHANFVVRFQNKTDRSCTLYGYPAVDAVKSDGTAIAHARRTLTGFTGGSSRGLQLITVHPGHFASSDIEWHTFNFATGGSCRLAPFVAVTPPNTTRTDLLKRSVTVCGLQVHPVVAGVSGNS